MGCQYSKSTRIARRGDYDDKSYNTGNRIDKQNDIHQQNKGYWRNDNIIERKNSNEEKNIENIVSALGI